MAQRISTTATSAGACSNMDIIVAAQGTQPVQDQDAGCRLPRRFVRMVPEGYDTTRAFFGWTWAYPSWARCMVTWRFNQAWHRLYIGFSWSLWRDVGWRVAWTFRARETWRAHKEED
jgi:hypothetical protein